MERSLLKGSKFCLQCFHYDCEHMKMPRHLTPREISVIRMVHDGATNQQIGARLGVGTQTVKEIISRSGGVFDKIGCINRVQLALWVQEHFNSLFKEETDDQRDYASKGPIQID